MCAWLLVCSGSTAAYPVHKILNSLHTVKIMQNHRSSTQSQYANNSQQEDNVVTKNKSKMLSFFYWVTKLFQDIHWKILWTARSCNYWKSNLYYTSNKHVAQLVRKLLKHYATPFMKTNRRQHIVLRVEQFYLDTGQNLNDLIWTSVKIWIWTLVKIWIFHFVHLSRFKV